MAIETVIQTWPATIGVFVAIFFFLSFFNDLFGVRGIFKVLVSAGIAFLFRNYWYLLIHKVVEILKIFGLEPL